MIIPFRVSNEVNFIVEFGEYKIRFFANHGQVVSGDTEYEISSPYRSKECQELQYCQNGDVLYIFHKNHPIHTLTRRENTLWVLEKFNMLSGPWDNVNTTTNSIISSNSGTGDTVLTSDTDLFTENDVGRLIRLTLVDNDYKPWVAEKDFAADQIVKSDGKYYLNMSGGKKSGNEKPTHTKGTISDGNIQWKYLHAGYGTARITEYVSPTEVNAHILDYMPIFANSTEYWELGLIHKGEEYPFCGAFYRNRFVFMVNRNGQPKVCFSNSDDYNNFADKDYGEVLATNSITLPVVGDKYAEACWLCPYDVLFVGTSTGEFVIDSAAQAEAFAPENAKIYQISNIGSKPIQPVAIGAHILFVTSSGTEVRDIVYSFAEDSYDPVNLSLLGKHLLTSGIERMVYQETPDKIVWFAVKDGRLIGMTFSSEQKVAALHQHTLDGDVVDLAVIPNPKYNYEDLWLITDKGNERAILWLDNGYPLQYPKQISSIEDYTDKQTEETKYLKDNAFYLDCGLSLKRELTSYFDVEFEALTNNFYDKTITITGDVSDSVVLSSESNKISLRLNRIKDNVLKYSLVADNENKAYRLRFNVIGAKYKVVAKLIREDVESGVYLTDIDVANGVVENGVVEFNLPPSSFFAMNFDSFEISFEIPFAESKDDVTLKGLDYLNNQTVKIMVNGAELEPQVVTNGEVIVPWYATDINVGLPIKSEFIPQKMYIQTDNSRGVGDVQRIDHVTLMLWRSLGGKIGENSHNLEDILFRKTDDKMNASAPLYTGNKKVFVNFRTTTVDEKGAEVLIYNDSVYPMNILAIAPHMTSSGGGL